MESGYESALCVCLDLGVSGAVERLRRYHHRSYGEWPPHLTVCHPFVARSEVFDTVERRVRPVLARHAPFRMRLEGASVFEGKQRNTVWLKPDEASASELTSIWEDLGGEPGAFVPHLTVAQYEARLREEKQQSLIEKVDKYMPVIEVSVDRLQVLVRNAQTKTMEQYCEVPLGPGEWQPPPLPMKTVPLYVEEIVDREDHDTYSYDGERWAPSRVEPKASRSAVIASYNVMGGGGRTEEVKKTLLTDGRADLVVLQEVTDAFLSDLLSDPAITSHYKYTTHPPPSEFGPLSFNLNVVALGAVPFTHYTVDLSDFKVAVVCRLANGAVVAGIHLSRGLTDDKIELKDLELEKLMDHLPQDNVIIAGDFNLPTNHYTIQMAHQDKLISDESLERLEGLEHFLQSRFTDCGQSKPTYDPTVNPLARSLEYPQVEYMNQPQRYDRILLAKQSEYAVTQFEVFGKATASDHWGVKARLGPSQPIDTALESAPPIEWQSTTSQSMLAEVKRLVEALTPSQEAVAARIEALKLFREVVSRTEPATPAVVVPVGSSGLGVWTAESDVDCLCIGALPEQAFFSNLIRKLSKVPNLRLVRRIDARSGTSLDIKVNKITFDVHYATCTAQYHNYRAGEPFPLPDSYVEFSTLSALKPLKDMIYLRRSGDADVRAATRVLKHWAANRGLYAPKLGYLGGIHIYYLLAHIQGPGDGELVTEIPPEAFKPFETAGHANYQRVLELILTFVHYYQHFDWAKDMVLDPTFHRRRMKAAGLNNVYSRMNEPMVILGLHPPRLNVAHAATRSSVDIIAAELARFALPLTSRAEARTFFLKSFTKYLKLEIHYWGQVPTTAASLLGWLESQTVSLVAQMDERCHPCVVARVWPERFLLSDLNYDDYQACYLIGLKIWEAKDPVALQHQFSEVCDAFLRRIRSNNSYFDATTTWVGLSVMKERPAEYQVDDNALWGGDLDRWDIREQQITKITYAALIGDDGEGDDEEPPPPPPPRARAKTDAKNNVGKTSVKLRSSQDVINRIRWDASYDISDYLVGYEDRFLGIQDRPLQTWVLDTNNVDEYIPLHRVVYFKRQSDGVIVWHKDTRVDLIFGSGGAGN